MIGITNVEIRRVAPDADFDVLGLDLAVEELGGDVWGEIDVDVHLLQGLIPFEHLLP